VGRVASLADHLAGSLPPPSGAVVMGTGIVSIGLSLDGHETLSCVLLAIAAGVWLVLGAGLAILVTRLRPRLLREARSPAALTGVAGTNVLGARLEMLGWTWPAVALLVVALLLWLLLVPYVLAHWTRPTVGSSFVLVVATESLATLAAAIAIRRPSAWLALAALACVAVGLACYLFVAVSFDLRQLLTGPGDHWVAGGALAIATLACARVTKAAAGIDLLRGAAGSLGVASLALWAAAVAWLPALLVSEVVRPRLAYDPRRWSTVFPLGMVAVCSFNVAQVEDLAGLRRFAAGWIWLAVAVWVVVSVGLVRRTVGTIRLRHARTL
jgi:tellurite resistance protein TehA-like permease